MSTLIGTMEDGTFSRVGDSTNAGESASTTDDRPRTRDLESCFLGEKLQTEYNNDPSVPPHAGLMFNLGSRNKAIVLTAMEIDIRADRITSDDDLNMEVYVSEEDDFPAGFFRDGQYWSKVADTKLLRDPRDNNRFLLPAYALTPIAFDGLAKKSIYLRMNGDFIDNKVDALTSPGDLAIDFGNLNVFAGYSVPQENGTPWPDALSTSRGPVFAGRVYLDVQEAFCPDPTIETTVTWDFAMDISPTEQAELQTLALRNDIDRFVSNAVQGDKLLLQYIDEKNLLKNGSIETGVTIREYPGTCPPAWTYCKSLVINTFFKHDDSLSSNHLKAQMYKHTKYLESVVKDNFPSDLPISNAGYTGEQAQFTWRLNNIPTSVTSLDQTQINFLEQQVISEVSNKVPSSFASVFKVVVQNQQVLGRRKLLRGLAETGKSLQLSGYLEAGRFGAEDPAQFAARVDSALDADGGASFLENLQFDIGIPGMDMENNARSEFFKDLTSLESTLDPLFEAPIDWVDGREPAIDEQEDGNILDKVPFDTDDASGLPVYAYVLIAVAVVGFILGCFFWMLTRNHKQKEKKMDKAMNEDDDTYADERRQLQKSIDRSKEKERKKTEEREKAKKSDTNTDSSSSSAEKPRSKSRGRSRSKDDTDDHLRSRSFDVDERRGRRDHETDDRLRSRSAEPVPPGSRRPGGRRKRSQSQERDPVPKEPARGERRSMARSLDSAEFDKIIASSEFDKDYQSEDRRKPLSRTHSSDDVLLPPHRPTRSSNDGERRPPSRGSGGVRYDRKPMSRTHSSDDVLLPRDRRPPSRQRSSDGLSRDGRPSNGMQRSRSSDDVMAHNHSSPSRGGRRPPSRSRSSEAPLSPSKQTRRGGRRPDASRQETSSRSPSRMESWSDEPSRSRSRSRSSSPSRNGRRA